MATCTLCGSKKISLQTDIRGFCPNCQENENNITAQKIDNLERTAKRLQDFYNTWVIVPEATIEAQDILRKASDESTKIIESATAEATRILTEAKTQAEYLNVSAKLEASAVIKQATVSSQMIIDNAKTQAEQICNSAEISIKAKRYDAEKELEIIEGKTKQLQAVTEEIISAAQDQIAKMYSIAAGRFASLVTPTDKATIAPAPSPGDTPRVASKNIPLPTKNIVPASKMTPVRFKELAPHIFLQAVNNPFVIFDFETTGLSPITSRIIEIGALKFDALCNVTTFNTLVNPQIKIPVSATEVNGITNELVADAPTIDAVLPDFLDFIGDATLIAHNASFDISFLRAACEKCGLSININYVDSLQLARDHYTRLPNHKLGTIAEHLNCSMEGLHRSLADCNVVRDMIFDVIGKTADSPKRVEVTAPGYTEKKPYPFRTHRKVSELQELPCMYNDEDFVGKYFAFTGTLESMAREKAEEIVIMGGGIIQNNITAKTTHLVIGAPDFRTPVGTMSGKEKKARDLIERGQTIHIITEKDFLSMIDDELHRTYELCKGAAFGC